MNKIVFETFADSETYDLAVKIAGIIRQKKNKNVVCLDGELGAGKTVFAKGFGAGLGIRADIVSPTFNIVKTYRGETVLHHFDVYRISDISELDEIGFDEFLFDDAVVLIEWSSLIADALPEDVIRVCIYKDIEKGFDYRRIVVEGMENEDFRD